MDTVVTVPLTPWLSVTPLAASVRPRPSERAAFVAVGLGYFQRIPEVLRSLPTNRVTHTWGHKDFDSYADKDVVVVGGGSSALETAALLHEHGARVTVLVRKRVYWGGHGAREAQRKLIERIRVPISSKASASRKAVARAVGNDSAWSSGTTPRPCGVV